jgi:hypothetical protein
MGDAEVLSRPIRATHKPNRKLRFSQTYAASASGRYLLDNGAILLAPTASAYKLVQRMFEALLSMPMR